jgi:hypothetical protein
MRRTWLETVQTGGPRKRPERSKRTGQGSWLLQVLGNGEVQAHGRRVHSRTHGELLHVHAWSRVKQGPTLGESDDLQALSCVRVTERVWVPMDGSNVHVIQPRVDG